MAGGARWRRFALAILVLSATAVATACDSSPSLDTDGGFTPASDVVFPRTVLWAQGSTIHSGDAEYDVSPRPVVELDWTPYGLFLGFSDESVNGGEATYAFFDGTTVQDLDVDVFGQIVTSADGHYAAWVDHRGPMRPAGQVAEVIAVEVATARVVFRSSSGMGGQEGDDLGARYSELAPGAVTIEGDRLFWRNGEGDVVQTDLASGSSTVMTTGEGPHMHPTSGYLFSSPDGRFEIDAQITGKLAVHPDRIDFGHPYQLQGGWLDDEHTMLVMGRDHFEWSYDPTKPDRTRGVLMSCDLETGQCLDLVHVVGTREVVFPGVDVDF